MWDMVLVDPDARKNGLGRWRQPKNDLVPRHSLRPNQWRSFHILLNYFFETC